jgi:hypothetical protein
VRLDRSAADLVSGFVEPHPPCRLVVAVHRPLLDAPACLEVDLMMVDEGVVDRRIPRVPGSNGVARLGIHRAAHPTVEAPDPNRLGRDLLATRGHTAPRVDDRVRSLGMRKDPLGEIRAPHVRGVHRGVRQIGRARVEAKIHGSGIARFGCGEERAAQRSPRLFRTRVHGALALALAVRVFEARARPVRIPKLPWPYVHGAFQQVSPEHPGFVVRPVRVLGQTGRTCRGPVAIEADLATALVLMPVPLAHRLALRNALDRGPHVLALGVCDRVLGRGSGAAVPRAHPITRVATRTAFLRHLAVLMKPGVGARLVAVFEGRLLRERPVHAEETNEAVPFPF